MRSPCCQYVSPLFKLLNHLTKFHKIWYGHYAITGQPSILCIFLQLVGVTCEMGVTFNGKIKFEKYVTSKVFWRCIGGGKSKTTRKVTAWNLYVVFSSMAINIPLELDMWNFACDIDMCIKYCSRANNYKYGDNTNACGCVWKILHRKICTLVIISPSKESW
jgi:hypothetical protein